MRIVFFGSSLFSVPTLLSLAASDRHELVGVAAQPDRPSGRNRKVQTGIVHETALNLGIPVITPEKIGSPDALAVISSWNPDAIVVASFGQYIPGRVLVLPPKGVINVHPSLLPKYRGAAPMQWSIANGETTSGVTIFQVVKEMDAGDIIIQEKHPVSPDDNAITLSERFSQIGAGLALKALDLMETGKVALMPQAHDQATFAPKITKQDGLIDWRLPARAISNRIRGFQPWPGGYFLHKGVAIKVWRTMVEPGAGEPGQIIEFGGAGPLIMTGEQAIRLLELQPEGKKSMLGSAFLCGHKWVIGDILNAAVTSEGKDIV